jgi:hypothetical protein
MARPRRERESSPARNDATAGHDGRSAPTVDLDALDLTRLTELVWSFRDRLEDYQRRAAASGFRVTIGASALWLQCPVAAAAVEAELSRLGLGIELALSTTSGRGLTTVVNDLRFLLLQMRDWEEAGWGVSVPAAGLWGAVGVGSRELPDLTPFLGQLRLLADDLPAVTAPPPIAASVSDKGPEALKKLTAQLDQWICQALDAGIKDNNAILTFLQEHAPDLAYRGRKKQTTAPPDRTYKGKPQWLRDAGIMMRSFYKRHPDRKPKAISETNCN